MRYPWVLLVFSVLMMAGCVTIPTDALKLSPSSLAERQLQTRVYEDVTEEQILSASVGIIQDLGAEIIETESDLGLIVGEKTSDAVDPGQGVGALILTLLGWPGTWDKTQKIRFSLVTGPVSSNENSERWFVRLTMQRVVWNTQRQITKIESVKDPEVFQGFFEKLDKSLFLEKQS